MASGGSGLPWERATHSKEFRGTTHGSSRLPLGKSRCRYAWSRYARIPYSFRLLHGYPLQRLCLPLDCTWVHVSPHGLGRHINKQVRKLVSDIVTEGHGQCPPMSIPCAPWQGHSCIFPACKEPQGTRDTALRRAPRLVTHTASPALYLPSPHPATHCVPSARCQAS